MHSSSDNPAEFPPETSDPKVNRLLSSFDLRKTKGRI
jgi:hypothetical protein